MYIIKTRNAFGPCYLIDSPTLAGRFGTKNQATLFGDIGDAKAWLAKQKDTMNAQIFERCEIVEG